MTDVGAAPHAGAILLTRRQGLLGALLLGGTGLLAACSSTAAPDSPTASATTPGESDATVADEQALISLYDQTIGAFPSLTAALAPIRAEHVEHLAALTGSTPATPSAAAPASAASTASTASPASQAGEKDAIAALIHAEHAAMRQRIDACVAAASPGLARTLAFIAASEGAHVPALKDVAA